MGVTLLATPPVSLMDMGYAILGSLARHRRSHIRFHRLASFSTLLSGPASQPVLFRPNPAGVWVEDLYL